MIFKGLRNIGINETNINIIEDIYTDPTAKVHIEKKMSEEILILRGVSQGDSFSPKLLTALIEEVSDLKTAISIKGAYTSTVKS